MLHNSNFLAIFAIENNNMFAKIQKRNDNAMYYI